jgi:hypothetical protein
MSAYVSVCLRMSAYVCVCVCLHACVRDSCVSYEEEDTCVSYEEEDTCVSYEEEDTCVCACMHACEIAVCVWVVGGYVCVRACLHACVCDGDCACVGSGGGAKGKENTSRKKSTASMTVP